MHSLALFLCMYVRTYVCHAFFPAEVHLVSTKCSPNPSNNRIRFGINQSRSLKSVKIKKRFERKRQPRDALPCFIYIYIYISYVLSFDGIAASNPFLRPTKRLKTAMSSSARSRNEGSSPLSSASSKSSSSYKRRRRRRRTNRASATDLVPSSLLEELTIRSSSSSPSAASFLTMSSNNNNSGMIGKGRGSSSGRTESFSAAGSVTKAAAINPTTAALMRARATDLELDSILSPFADFGASRSDDSYEQADHIATGTTTSSTDDDHGLAGSVSASLENDYNLDILSEIVSRSASSRADRKVPKPAGILGGFHIDAFPLSTSIASDGEFMDPLLQSQSSSHMSEFQSANAVAARDQSNVATLATYLSGTRANEEGEGAGGTGQSASVVSSSDLSLGEHARTWDTARPARSPRHDVVLLDEQQTRRSREAHISAILEPERKRCDPVDTSERCTALEKEMEIARQAMDILRRERNEAVEAAKRRDEALARVRERNRRDSSDASKRCAVLEKELERARQATDILHRERDEAVEATQGQDKALAQVQLELSSLAEQKACLEIEGLRCTEQKTSVERERDELLQKVNKMKKDTVESNETMANLRAEHDDFFLNHESEIRRHEESAKEALRDELIDKRNETKSNVSRLKAAEYEMASLRAVIDQKLEAIGKLQSDLDSTKDQKLSAQEELNALKDTNEELRSTAARISAENESFKRQLSGLQNDFSSLKKGNEDAQAMLSDLEEAHSALVSMEALLANTEREKACLIEAADELELELSREKEQRKELNFRDERLRVELDDTRAVVQALRDELASERDETSSTKQELQGARATITELVGELDAVKTEKDSAEKEYIDSLAASASDQLSELESVRAQAMAAVKDSEKTKRERLKMELDENETTVQALRDELASARATITELIGELDAVKSEKDSAEKEYIDSLAASASELEKVRAQAVAAVKDGELSLNEGENAPESPHVNDSLELETRSVEECQRCEQEMDASKDSISPTSTTSAAEDNSIHEGGDVLTKRLTDLERSLQAKDEEIDNLQRKLEVGTKNDAKDATKIASLEKQVQEMEQGSKNVINELVSELDTAKSEIISISEKAEEANSRADHLDLEATVLRERFSKAKAEMIALLEERVQESGATDTEGETFDLLSALEVESLEMKEEYCHSIIGTSPVSGAERGTETDEEREGNMNSQLCSVDGKTTCHELESLLSKITELQDKLGEKDAALKIAQEEVDCIIMIKTKETNGLKSKLEAMETDYIQQNALLEQMKAKMSDIEGEIVRAQTDRGTDKPKVETRPLSDREDIDDSTLFVCDEETEARLYRVEESLRQTKVELAAALTAYNLPQRELLGADTDADADADVDVDADTPAPDGVIAQSIELLRTLCKFVGTDTPIGDADLEQVVWQSLGRLRRSLSDTDWREDPNYAGTNDILMPFNGDNNTNASEDLDDDDSLLRDLTLSFSEAFATLGKAVEDVNDKVSEEIDTNTHALGSQETRTLVHHSETFLQDFRGENDFQSEGRFGTIIACNANHQFDSNEEHGVGNDDKRLEIQIVPELQIRCESLENERSYLLNEKEDLLNETIVLLETSRAEHEAELEAAVAKVRAEAAIEIARFKEEWQSLLLMQQQQQQRTHRSWEKIE